MKSSFPWDLPASILSFAFSEQNCYLVVCLALLWCWCFMVLFWHFSFLIKECTVVMCLGRMKASGPPILIYRSPPILLCETSKGSEFDWIKTTKRKDIMIYDWTSGDGNETSQTGNESFDKFFVMQISSIAAIIAQ